MAATWENVLQGYDVNRFDGDVREDLLCSVCHDVPKDPRLCQNRDHLFCFDHISRHLHENSHTCPVCRDPLTPETLRRPEGFLKNYLDDLRIKCDHDDRGCPDIVRLEHLHIHVNQCGFAPVMCENDGCGVIVNKRDQENHEKNLCQFRITKCHDCTDIKASQNEIKVQITQMEDQIKESQARIEVRVEEIKEQDDEIKQYQAQTREEFNEMKNKIAGIERKQDEMKQSVDTISQQFEKIVVMVNQAFQGRTCSINNNGAQAIDPTVPDNNQEIIILGGFFGPEDDAVSNTAEKFNIKGGSTQLPSMNLSRTASASCLYNGDVFIVGGHDGRAGTDTIEVLKMRQHPLQWMELEAKLPVKLSGHVAIVYQGKLCLIGGYNWNEGRISDAIYAMTLTPPYLSQLLTRMSQPRTLHRAEVVNGKLFILGGSATSYSKDAVDSVEVFDFITNECVPCASLPKPVCFMSTVTWGGMIIVVGGMNNNKEVLNDIIMYDPRTGQSQILPSMKFKRCGSSAVIMNNLIVVLGGWNGDQGHLNLVESFAMGSDVWEEQQGITEIRHRATAVVNPHN